MASKSGRVLTYGRRLSKQMLNSSPTPRFSVYNWNAGVKLVYDENFSNNSWMFFCLLLLKNEFIFIVKLKMALFKKLYNFSATL